MFNLTLVETSSLSAKQKRIQEWRELINSSQISDPSIKRKLLELVTQLSGKLVDCWKAERITEQDFRDITNLERQIENLNEEGRLVVKGRNPNQTPPLRF